MAERLNPAKEPAMLSPKCMSDACDRTGTHLKKDNSSDDTAVIHADVSNSQAPEPQPSEQKIQHGPDKGGIMIQYIHFTLNKEGCLE